MMIPRADLLLDVLAYYGIASACTLLVMVHDKLAARAARWRVPERNLHLMSVAGGWMGAWLACIILRHKIRKNTFQIRLWFATVTNILLLTFAVTAYIQFGGFA